MTDFLLFEEINYNNLALIAIFNRLFSRSHYLTICALAS